jgi:hypothetical protein
MHSNNNELVKAGHDLAAELNASCGAVNLRDVAKLITALTTQLDVTTAALRATQAERDHLAAQLADVVAENAALKAFGDKLNDMHNDLNGEGTGIQGRAEVACQQVALEAAIDEFSAMETPATDIFLAEQRAVGVEMFAEKCSQKSKQAISSDTRDSWWLCGEHASDYAAQLRNEVKV